MVRRLRPQDPLGNMRLRRTGQRFGVAARLDQAGRVGLWDPPEALEHPRRLATKIFEYLGNFDDGPPERTVMQFIDESLRDPRWFTARIWKDWEVKLRLGIALWLLSWVPYGLILGLSGAWLTVAWAVEIAMGIVGLALSGTEFASAVKDRGWRGAPAVAWRAMLRGKNVDTAQ